MDLETTLVECVFVAADIFLLGTFYKLYRNRLDCLKSLQEAEHLEINSELKKSVSAAGGAIPYAVIAGNVKALTTPIRSRHFSFLQGVIYEQITKERKLRRSPVFHIWDSFDSAVKTNTAHVPFGLSGGGFFKKQVVEVIDPLTAQELVLSKVYDDFKEHEESFADVLLGFVRGEHTIGTLEVESMLLENSSLTAVGKVIIENEKLKITPPGDGLTYFLTPLSLNSLVQKIKDDASFYKVLFIIMSGATVALFAYLTKKGYSEVKRRINHARQLKRCEEARVLRRKADPSRKSEVQENSPKCVVCLENPVEILILECGHICLCLNCSEQFNTLCPVCRAKIQRLVPAFLP